MARCKSQPKSAGRGVAQKTTKKAPASKKIKPESKQVQVKPLRRVQTSTKRPRTRPSIRLEWQRRKPVRLMIRRALHEQRNLTPLVNYTSCHRLVVGALSQLGTRSRISVRLIQGLHQLVESNYLTILSRAVRLTHLQEHVNRHGQSVPKGTQMLGRHLMEAFRVWTEDNCPQAWDRFVKVTKFYVPFLLSKTESRAKWEAERTAADKQEHLAYCAVKANVPTLG